jgi:hypothetical protein
MKLRYILHIAGGAVALVALYDMVAPSVSTSLPVLPMFPTTSNYTNLLIGGGLFALPLFF